MTFNIRYDSPHDGKNGWNERKNEVCQLINYYHPEFVGIQESMPLQVRFIDQNLKNYAYIGFGRDGKGTNSESVPIFYDSTKYELINSNVFWLSETPEKVSLGWDAALNRIATFGAFKNISSPDTLYIINVHFDHIGVVARKNSSQVILDKVNELKLDNERVIIMGDFNSQPEDASILTLKDVFEDAFEKTKITPYGPTGTFNGFDNEIIPTNRIDYVFTRNIDVLTYRSINDKRLNSLCISDHLPILVEIGFPNY